MLTQQRLEEIAANVYDEFYAECEAEAIERCGGDKVRGLNEMQGFEYEDHVATDDDMRSECDDKGVAVPENAIGCLVLHSVAEIGRFFTPDDDATAEKEIRGLYW